MTIDVALRLLFNCHSEDDDVTTDDGSAVSLFGCVGEVSEPRGPVWNMWKSFDFGFEFGF